MYPSVSWSPDWRWAALGIADSALLLVEQRGRTKGIRISRETIEEAELSSFLDKNSNAAVTAGLYSRPVNLVRAVAWRPDGRRVAFAHGDAISVWDLESNSPSKRFKDKGVAIRALTFSPDGQLLASGNEDGSIDIWNDATPVRLHRLHAHCGFIQSIQFSPDGTRLLSAGADACIHLWNLENGLLIDTMGKHPVDRALVFSPAARRLVAGYRLLDGGSYRILSSFSRRHSPGIVDFSPNGARIALSCRVGLQIWNCDSGMVTALIRDAYINRFSWGDDDRTFIQGVLIIQGALTEALRFGMLKPANAGPFSRDLASMSPISPPSRITERPDSWHRFAVRIESRRIRPKDRS